MNVGIICGYGIFNQQNKSYKSYLDQVYKYSKINKLNKIIVCGGYTDSLQPSVSESRSIINYLSTKLVRVSFYDEDKSLTTYQNLINSKKIISNFDDKDDLHITIFCDSIRLPKIYIHTRDIFFNDDIDNILQDFALLIDTAFKNIPNKLLVSIKNIQIYGINFNHTKNIIAKQIYMSTIKSHYSRNINFHNRFLIKRKKLWKLK